MILGLGVSHQPVNAALGVNIHPLIEWERREQG